MNARSSPLRFIPRLRGQLVLLLHRDARIRQILTLELLRLGYSVLPLEHERDLRGYLDGARAYDARVAFPDVLLADELTLGITGLRRLARLRETASLLPVVLLSDFPMTSVTDEEMRASLHVAAVLRRPYTRHQLARTMADVLPAPYPDEAARRS